MIPDHRWPYPIHDVDPSDPATMGCSCTCTGCQNGRCHVLDRPPIPKHAGQHALTDRPSWRQRHRHAYRLHYNWTACRRCRAFNWWYRGSRSQPRLGLRWWL